MYGVGGLEPISPQKFPIVPSTFPISPFAFRHTDSQLCVLLLKERSKVMLENSLESLISLTDLGLGVLGFGDLGGFGGKRDRGAPVVASFLSLSFWVIIETCNGPTRPPSLKFFRFVLQKGGGGPKVWTHAHCAHLPKTSKKPSPSRFKHDSPAQRLSPPTRGEGGQINTDKAAHEYACTHSQTDRDTLTPLDKSQKNLPPNRFVREVVSVSGVDKFDGHNTKRWQFLFLFTDRSVLLVFGLSGAPALKGQWRKLPHSRWYQLTSRLLQKCTAPHDNLKKNILAVAVVTFTNLPMLFIDSIFKALVVGIMLLYLFHFVADIVCNLREGIGLQILACTCP